MIAAGCRFFAGYPMTPFTEVLEHMARRLPTVGGVCMNAESELEAVGMAWGAAATGTPAATGSTGQGLSLMQESLAEITLARLPLVVLNMARAQGDYYQATRGGGHGDYRHIVLAPADAAEAVELVGAGLRAHRAGGATRCWSWATTTWPTRHRSVALPRGAHAGRCREWALDGSSGGSGHAKLISFLGTAKQRDDVGYDLADHYAGCAAATGEMVAGVEPLAEAGRHRRRRGGGGGLRHAGHVRPGRGARAAGRGRRVGYVRPDHPRSPSPPRRGRRPPRAPGRWPSTRTTRARWSTTCAWPCSARLRSTSSAG